jgi:hypothetical protein
VKNWGGVFLCVLVTCLPSVATASDRAPKPSFEVHERALRLALKVKASNGYEGWLTTEGHRRVTLTLLKGYTRVEARTSGRVTRRGIDAEFGELGEISVRFRGRPFRPTLRKGERRCRGRRSALEKGVFSGTIRFQGENGFARIDTGRATGYVERHYRRVCLRDSSGDSFRAAFESLFGKIRLTVLRASGRVDRANVFLEASAIDLRPILGPEFGLEYIVSAHSVEHREGVLLTRQVGVVGAKKSSFLFSHKEEETPRAATVALPKPFNGTAKYLKEPGLPASWVGTLAAHLPGAGLVALTGPGFRADICRLNFAALIKGDGCLSKPGQAQMRLLRAWR